MGNKCIAQSGEEYYKAINYQRFRNETDLNKKYQFKNKIFSKKEGIKTIKVFDMVFSKTRIMKQVPWASASTSLLRIWEPGAELSSRGGRGVFPGQAREADSI